MADTDSAAATEVAASAAADDAAAASPKGSPVAQLRSASPKTRRRRSSMDSVDSDFAEVQEMFPMRSTSMPGGDLAFAKGPSSLGGAGPPPTTPNKSKGKDKRRGSVMLGTAEFQRSNSINDSPKSKHRSRSLILNQAITRKLSLTSPTRKSSLMKGGSTPSASRQSRMGSLSEVTSGHAPADCKDSADNARRCRRRRDR